ncbi:P27 family phage terminase small subunit [Paraburkholderia sp. SIMBA_049]
MGARGRPSHTETEGDVVALRVVPSGTMEPVRGMPKAQRAIWREVVTSFPAGHFAPCDRALLEAFASAAVRANELAKVLDTEGVIITNPSSGRKVINPAHTAYTTACATMSLLAGKLRICPSSRMRQDAADAKPVTKAAEVKRPWSR